MTYMLDTNICIYVMKQKPEAVLARFKKAIEEGDSLCISAITLAELEYGIQHSSAPARNEWMLLQFLAPITILPFGANAASTYGGIRACLQSQGTPIGPLDTLIAGHAKAEDLTLVTNNVREFARVPGLKVTNWVQP